MPNCHPCHLDIAFRALPLICLGLCADLLVDPVQNTRNCSECAAIVWMFADFVIFAFITFCWHSCHLDIAFAYILRMNCSKDVDINSYPNSFGCVLSNVYSVLRLVAWSAPMPVECPTLKNSCGSYALT